MRTRGGRSKRHTSLAYLQYNFITMRLVQEAGLLKSNDMFQLLLGKVIEIRSVSCSFLHNYGSGGLYRKSIGLNNYFTMTITTYSFFLTFVLSIGQKLEEEKQTFGDIELNGLLWFNSAAFCHCWIMSLCSNMSSVTRKWDLKTSMNQTCNRWCIYCH